MRFINWRFDQPIPSERGYARRIDQDSTVRGSGGSRTTGLKDKGAGVLSVALVVILGVAACSAGGATQGAKSVLTLGLTAEPISLDPAKDGTTPYMTVRALTNEAITHLNKDGSIGPGLAVSWRYIGTGNKDFEFELRKDARFSDGEPVTAEAVKKWLEYFAKSNGPSVSQLGPIRSIDTVGQRTVRLHLKAANPMIPAVLSEAANWGFVSSPKAIAKSKTLSSGSAGAGPYVLVPSETVGGDHYTFKPNKHYYDKEKIRFKKIVAKVIPTASSMLQAFKTGQVDVALGDPSTADAAAASGTHIVRAPTLTRLYTLDPSGAIAKPLGDVRVRQALNYAIDRKAITSAIAGEYGAPTSQMATPDGWDPEYAGYYAYDPKKAKELLADAGYQDGFNIRVLVQGKFEGSFGQQLTQTVAKNLADVGVNVSMVTTATVPEYGQVVQKNTPKDGFPVIQAPSTDSRSMWLQYGIYAAPEAIFNKLGWHDPVLTKLWRQGQTAADPAPYWKRMSRRIVEQAYLLPVLRQDAVYYVSDDVAGVSIPKTHKYPLATEWSWK